MRFGDQAHAYRVDTPTSHQKQTCRLTTKVSWLFDESSDNNASDDGLSLLVSVEVISVMSGNDAIYSAYLWHTKLMSVIILMYVTAHSAGLANL